MMPRGNPYFIQYRRQNIKELRNRLLRDNPHKTRNQILADFAYEKALRIEKVREYYRLLQATGEIE